MVDPIISGDWAEPALIYEISGLESRGGLAINKSSIHAQSTAEPQPHFYGGHSRESASAAPVKFDRWTVSLSAIDRFLRGKSPEAVENIAERMCRRAERQQGIQSFNLSNLKKDLAAFGLPVVASRGRSQDQRVRIVTGLILRLQTEANSGSAARPLGNSFCGLIKKTDSSIVEGMQQLLNEVNGHFATNNGLADVTGKKLYVESFINENLHKAEALITTSESDPFGFNEQRASKARGYLVAAADGCEQLLDSTQRNGFLDKYRNLGLRLQKILEEQKGETIRKNVEELFNKANTAIDCFSSPVKEAEIKEVEALIEQARLKIKSELSDSNYETIRNGLLKKRQELEEKLQRYKDNISESQQTTATNSEVKNEKDPIKKEFDDYWKQYTRTSTLREGQVLECSKSDPRNDRIDKINKLMVFYKKSLDTAETLQDKLFDMPAYKKECLILDHNIDHMRKQMSELERLKREPIGCFQS